MSDPRVGLGYDIHRLAAGRRLVIGGVALEHPKGLVGHSDGDVLVHAVMDALLGAAGLGDLGTHFPSDDPAHEGADSLVLLRRVSDLVREGGFSVRSVDATLVCEEPRIGPHALAMRAAIAKAMDVDADVVSVKAKTNEGLGPVGSGEAISALAIALISR